VHLHEEEMMAISVCKTRTPADRAMAKLTAGTWATAVTALAVPCFALIPHGSRAQDSSVQAQSASSQMSATQTITPAAVQLRPPLISVPGSKNGLILTSKQKAKLKVLVTDRNGKPTDDASVRPASPESGSG